MVEKSFGLLFYLKKPKNAKAGERYVYLKITVDGIPKEIAIKRIWNCWILRFELCQSFRSDSASDYGSNDATLVV